MHHLAQLIDQFGYLAVLVGTFLEGETILVLAGFAAHQGYLDLRLTILAAFVGSAAGDQLWFLLARHHGRRWLDSRPKLAARLAPASRWLERNPTLFILGFRFVYGIRNVAPVAIGLSNIPARRFVLLNLLAAAVWACLFAVIGYVFGEAVEAVLGRLKAVEQHLFAAGVLCVLFYFAARWLAGVIRRRIG